MEDSVFDGRMPALVIFPSVEPDVLADCRSNEGFLGFTVAYQH